MRNCSRSQGSQCNGRCVVIHTQPPFAPCFLPQPFQLWSGLLQKKSCFIILNICKGVIRCCWFVPSAELLWRVFVLPWHPLSGLDKVVGWPLGDFEMLRIFRRLGKEFSGQNLTLGCIFRYLRWFRFWVDFRVVLKDPQCVAHSVCFQQALPKLELNF